MSEFTVNQLYWVIFTQLAIQILPGIAMGIYWYNHRDSSSLAIKPLSTEKDESFSISRAA